MNKHWRKFVKERADELCDSNFERFIFYIGAIMGYFEAKIDRLKRRIMR